MAVFKQRVLGPLFFVLFAAWLALPAAGVVISWATVGDPGNVGDTAIMKQDGSTGYGAVPYSYQISKYDVTNAQYVDFLNAKDPTGANTLGLYSGFQTADANVAGINFNSGAPNGGKYSVISGHGNQPVTYVTWYSAIRFANWMNNGQGNADTESGSYTIVGGTQTPSAVSTRNAAGTIFLPSENEWYKAAYYKGGGTNAGYWTFATQSNTAPVSSPPTSTPGHANYNDKVTGYALTGSPSYSTGTPYLTDVGAYSNSPSVYGTFDQSGDIFQWNEAVVASNARGIRGGSWSLDDGALPSTNRDQLYQPQYANDFIGFRLADTQVLAPEPTGAALYLTASLVLLRRRRRAS